MPFLHRLLLAAVLAAAACPATAGDDEARLKDLRARIERLQQELNATRGSRDAAREEVRDLERRIGTALRSLRRLDARLQANSNRLAALQVREKRERAHLRVQAQALEHEVRAAYAIGRQEPLKLALNQEDPARVTRMLVYYRALYQARAARMEDIRATLDRIGDLEREVRAQRGELAQARATQAEEQRTLETARARRAGLLAALEREVRSQTGEIERLRADEKRLERLIGEIESAMPPLPPPGPGARFPGLKGRLPLPLQGRVVARFGEPKRIGNLKWRGVFLAAREGQEVRAVHRGRVAYADWLRGFGLLLILEHGDGYMTLYGHNQGLYREVGDWVEAGEAIAAAGSTGDARQPGVYFEIRRHGEPDDPLSWCAAQGRANAAGAGRAARRGR